MTLAAILDQLDCLAAQSPVVIVLEDAHWIDPTSLDLLDRAVARVATLPVLLIITFRPEFHPSWIGQPYVTMLPLSRLGRRDSAAIVAGVAGDKALPDAVVEQVLAQADGPRDPPTARLSHHSSGRCISSRRSRRRASAWSWPSIFASTFAPRTFNLAKGSSGFSPTFTKPKA
jgi:hypothetical protein